MNCDWVKANVTLYVFDELADDARYELEQHVGRCAQCAEELRAMQEFQTALAAIPVLDPTPNLLTASRMSLQEALESTEPYRGWRRWVLEPMHWFHQMRLAPAATALLLMIGFGAGVGTTYRMAGRTTVAPATTANLEPAAPATSDASIVGIRGISAQPGTNQVDIKYDTIVPQTASGNLDSPRIQQLLLYGARNNSNSGVRVDSVDLLAHMPDDDRIRRVLMYALHNDSNPGVRLKALDALGPYVHGDIRVRDAVLDALRADHNPGVRTQAIELLKAVRADASVQQVLEHLATQDREIWIRNLSRSILASTPQID
jgi:hypothetical protein